MVRFGRCGRVTSTGVRLPFHDPPVSEPQPVHLPRPRFSLATQILGLQLVVLAITVLLGTVASLWLVRSELDRQYQQRAVAVAESVAALPEVRTAVATGSDTATIQPLAEGIRTSSGASFVVVTDARGLRLSHPNPALIGLLAIDPR